MKTAREFLFAGILSKRVPLLPISNRAVKAFRPDDTCREAGKVRYAGMRKFSRGFLFDAGGYSHYYKNSKFMARRWSLEELIIGALGIVALALCGCIKAGLAGVNWLDQKNEPNGGI